MLELIYAVKFCLNSFPAKDSVSAKLIPQAMITGQFVNLTKRCLIELGECVHTHEDEENFMNP